MALTPSLINKNYKKITNTFNEGVSATATGGYYGFDPRSVPNCSLCLDAKDPYNVTGSNPVTLWKNLTVLMDMSIDGTTGVTYNSSTGMQFPSGYLSGKEGYVGNLSTTDFTIFIVVNFVSSNVSQTLLEKGTGWSLSFDSLNKLNFSYTGSSVTTSALTSGKKIITINALRTSSTTIYINGSSSASTTTVNSNNIGNPDLMNIGSGFKGSIYEILMYTDSSANGVMSSNQRQQIEGYLGWKWGIALATGHTYVSMKPFLVDFRPPDLGSCRVWFDASDSSTLSGSGSSSFKWLDKSGYSNDAKIYIRDDNKQKYPSFSATNPQGLIFSSSSGGTPATCLTLSSSTFYNSPSNTSVFVVFSASNFSSTSGNGGFFNALVGCDLPSGRTSWSASYGIGSSTSGTAIDRLIITSPYGVGSSGARFSASIGTGNTFATSTKYIVQYYTGSSNTPSTSDAYQNGNLFGSGGTSTNDYRNGSQRQMTIGGIGSSQYEQNGFNGTIYEIIVYQSKVFTTAQRQIVEGYLAWKWNASPSLLNPDLPTGHSFSRFPSATVVPYPTPGTY